MQRGQALIYLLIGVLILGAIGGAYYFGKHSSSQSSPASIYQTSQPNSATSADETANWKTYTNSLGNYLIKIPTGWEIDDHQGSFIGLPGEALLIPPDQKTIPFGQTNI